MTEAGPVAIAWAGPEDAADVARMVAALSAHEGKPPPRFDAATYARDVAAPDAFVKGFLARRAGEALGYTLFHPAYDTESGERGSYMVDLYVEPASRSHGLGRALMAAVARATAAGGGSFLWWSAKTWNKPAMGFYARLAEEERHVATWACFGQTFRALCREAT